MKAVPMRANRCAKALVVVLLASVSITPIAIAQQALPTGGQVVAGNATIAVNGPAMEINQSSDAMIANWQSFSIGSGNSVTFNQPNAQSVALNRVIGQDPSQILGRLMANGKVFLVNPNGIVIGKDGMVQSGGFVASTLGLTDGDFLDGAYRFTGSGGTILNQGDLKGGVVALIAPRVSNSGTIAGDTALAGGTDVTLDFDGDGLISVEVDAASLATLVENKGLIKADDGLVILTAKGASDAMKGVVNNTGVIEASSLESRDGRILLLGDMEHGEVNAAGTLEAPFVETSAAQVNIADDIQVKTDGGRWLIDPNDFVIAANGGNMTGAAITNNLVNGNVDITTLGRGGASDIIVNDSVTWSSHTLTLDADRNIVINAPLFGSGTAGLTLAFAQRNVAGDYFINAPVNLASTGNFTTFENTSSGNLITRYTIVTSLGTETSSNDGTLQGLRGNLNANIVLGRNIDASGSQSWNAGKGFDPIKIFSGNFDGLGHSITDLSINRPTEDGIALFGSTDNQGPVNFIKNISLTNAKVMGHDNVGSLIGFAGFTIIKNSSSSGSVSGNRSVGGLIGYHNAGEISESFSRSNVIGDFKVGGLVGQVSGNSNHQMARVYASGSVSAAQGDAGGLVGDSGGTIQDAYALGDVSGSFNVGGLVGRDGSALINVFATGKVTSQGVSVGGISGTVVSGGVKRGVLWDTEATGQSRPFGTGGSVASATGLTTAQMKTSAPFIAAGWDFTNVWAIDPAINNGYPYLRATVAPTVVVAPPPPPPPPVVVLAVNDFGSSFSTSTAPFQPTIALSGSGFSSVTEVRFTWTDPNGRTGSATFNAANNFGGGRFVVGADGNSATISPVLVAANDPAGAYQWSITFVSGTQSVTRSFVVNYTAVATPPPPPPPAPVTLAVNDFGMTFSTMTAPFQPTIALSGTGLSGVTEVRFTFTDPNGQTGTAVFNTANNFGGGRFVVGADGTTATISPVLVAANDPVGTYQWSVTFVSGSQSVTRNFAVTYTAVVTPPPPPPPVPVVLAVNDFGMTFSSMTAPFQPTIALSGTGLSGVTEIRFTFTDPNGQTGTAIFNMANNFGNGRFVVAADGNSATISPVLIAANDPAGAYQWTVTFVSGTQSVTKNFVVNYTVVVAPPPPPPPPPPPAPLSLTGGVDSFYATGTTPYRETLNLTGQGLNGVTRVVFTWTDPTGQTGSATFTAANNNFDGRYVASSSGRMATITPLLVAAGDPPGIYRWSVSLTNGSQTVTRDFLVNFGPPLSGDPIVTVTQPGTDSGIVFGVVTGDEAPVFVETTTAGSTPASTDTLSELRQKAALLNAANTGVAIYEAYNGVVDALIKLQDIIAVVNALNEFGINTERLAQIDKLGTQFFALAANLLLDKAYDDAARKGISMPIPQPVAEALLNNAIYIATGDLAGSLSGLGGQFQDIATGYLALEAQNSTLVFSELSGAIVEINAFRSGALSYEFVLSQVAQSRNLITTLTDGSGAFFNRSTATQIGIIADLQELRVRQLNGENVSLLIAELSLKYAGSEFADKIAAQLGVLGW